MTAAQTALKRATEENLKEYKNIVIALEWVRAATSTELIDSKTAAPHISRIMERLEDLKPYLFPETNKVNY